LATRLREKPLDVSKLNQNERAILFNTLKDLGVSRKLTDRVARGAKVKIVDDDVLLRFKAFRKKLADDVRQVPPGQRASIFKQLLDDFFKRRDLLRKAEVESGIATKFASGGQVRGPGGPRSDNIPALLSPGEFVLPARAVNRFPGGISMLNALARGTVKGFQAGGLIGPGSGEELPSIPARAAAGVDLDKLSGVITQAIADAIESNPIKLDPEAEVKVQIPDAEDLPKLQLETAELPPLEISTESQASLASPPKRFCRKEEEAPCLEASWMSYVPG